MFTRLLKHRKKTQKESYGLKETSVITAILLKFWGLAIYRLQFKNGKVTKKLLLIPTFCLAWWICFSSYFAYYAFNEDQSIVRAFYSTKLMHYGDAFEKISSLVFFLFAVVKISFHLSGATAFFQDIVYVDDLLENQGVKIDYDHQARHDVFFCIIQSFTLVLRATMTIWNLKILGENIPWAKIQQMSFSDAVALFLSIRFYDFLKILTMRYKYVNQILAEISDLNRHKVTSTTSVVPINTDYPVEMQSSKLNDRIRECARIYGVLYKVSQKVNKKFGLAIAITISLSISLIILNSFYFLEATSAGLFHDVKRYINFLTYISWSIMYNALVIYLIVYSSEMTVTEANKTSTIIYEVSNSGLNQLGIAEVQKFSLQLLHQCPLFTAAGLIKVDNALLLEAAKFFITFMGLLLQFATSSSE